MNILQDHLELTSKWSWNWNGWKLVTFERNRKQHKTRQLFL